MRFDRFAMFAHIGIVRDLIEVWPTDSPGMEPRFS